jgi:coatomer protein complex subunit alpha (xenin)
MQKIADARGDPMSRFHNALYAGDVQGRISVLRDVGMRMLLNMHLTAGCWPHAFIDPLAYLTAKTNGLDDLAAEILEAAGLTEADVDDIPSFGASTLKPPPVITSTTDLLWPSLSTGESFFDRALVNGQIEGGVEPAYVNGDASNAASGALDAWAKEEEEDEIPDADEAGWELEADGGEFQDAEDGEGAGAGGDLEEELGAGATPGPSETELWVRNSPLAADHVAAGSFETAMQVRHNAFVGYLFTKLCLLIFLTS